MAFVDLTAYPAGQIPELAISQLFAKNDLPTNIRLGLAARSFGNFDFWQGLGNDPTKVIDAIKRICPALPWP